MSRSAGGGGHDRYLVDPGTGALLEEQEIDKGGTTDLRSTYVARGVVPNPRTAVPAP